MDLENSPTQIHGVTGIPRFETYIQWLEKAWYARTNTEEKYCSSSKF